ncbi:MAG: thiamine pyrophosphate-binding protein [Chloroflexi bacterium]|nr:thiamine pyrophosphate-binding protein [Chloroflexota bacterium]
MEQLSPKSLKGGELIADYLIAEGVPFVVGLCGHGNVGFLNALYDRADRLKFISVHHESVAGFMADAYFRVRHRPIATLTSCGPGSANMPIAVASAMMDSSAFLAITGNVPTSQFNHGPFQETYRYFQADATQIFRPYVKRSFQASRAEMLPTMLRQAFKTMLTGRFGPVQLDVPLDVFIEETAAAVPVPGEWHREIDARPAADPATVARAVDLLLHAERPVIMTGHGTVISEAAGELTALARLLHIPVVNTPNGKGGIDMFDPLSLGDVGRNGTYPANAVAQSCDVLFAIGCRFDDRVSSSWLPGYSFSIPPTKLIQIDIDPEELGRNYPVALGLVGDARSVLRQLLAEAGSRRVAHDRTARWFEQIARWQRVWSSHLEQIVGSDAQPIHPARLVHEVRAALPRDGILLVDVGVHHNWIVQNWRTALPQTVLQSWGFASMGFAVGGVLGAKLAAPDRPVVSLCGDGGFLMTANAVVTAVEAGIPAVWVVWNNSGYLSIRDLQVGLWPNREIGTSFRKESNGELHDIDYAAMARAMGAQGRRITQPAELGAALREALRAGVPYVLEVIVDRDILPPAIGGWALPPLPAAKPNFHPDSFGGEGGIRA